MNIRAPRPTPCLLLLIFVGSMAVSADANELFKTVDGSKLEKIENYSKRSLGEQRYFAKRSRVVEVDAEVLFGDEPVVLNLFDDVVFLAEGRSTGNERSGSWRGRITDPVPPLAEFDVGEDQLARLGLTKEEFYEFLFGGWLSVTQWSVSPRTGEAFFTPPQERFGVIAPEGMEPDENPLRMGTFYSVGGYVQYGAATYRIRALEFLPKYHLVYEIDPVKFFSYPAEGDYSMRAGEQREKLETYRDHVSTLPPRVEGKAIRGDVP